MSKVPNLEEMLKLWSKKDLWERIQQHIQTIDQLKQQLAEKDKEISKLQASYQQVKDYKHHAEFWQSAYKRCVDREKQSQTQLAIQELERVKEFMNETYGYDCCADVSIVDTFINQQIKELKGE